MVRVGRRSCEGGRFYERGVRMDKHTRRNDDEREVIAVTIKRIDSDVGALGRLLTPAPKSCKRLGRIRAINIVAGGYVPPSAGTEEKSVVFREVERLDQAITSQVKLLTTLGVRVEVVLRAPSQPPSGNEDADAVAGLKCKLVAELMDLRCKVEAANSKEAELLERLEL